MDKYTLPTSFTINDIECSIDSDYRNVLKIFQIFNDPDLVDYEKIVIALDYFYTTEDYKCNIEQAIKCMMEFIQVDDLDETTTQPSDEKPLYDWEQDFNIIIAPINRVIGTDVRGLNYLHWWTFLSAFMEIGECTFNTFVGIRNKLNKGIKLEKHEEKLYKENKDKINLKPKYDSTTQNLIDEILGKGV